MKSVKILTRQASPGMVIANDIYTFNNQLIIPTGTVLTDKVITRLKFYSIKMERRNICLKELVCLI